MTFPVGFGCVQKRRLTVTWKAFDSQTAAGRLMSNALK